MPIFPILELEPKVQTNDKTRLDATKSFKTADVTNVSLVRIKPDNSETFFTVASTDPTDNTKWFLDWIYSLDGVKTVTVEITDSATPTPNVTTKTMDLEVFDAADERLFSLDADLVADEPDVLKYVKAGRSSYIDLHRSAQDSILEELYKNKILAHDGTKITIDEVLDTKEVNKWSKYMVLKLIYDGIWNSTDDVYFSKARHYEKLENQWREMSFNKLKLDYNKDGVDDPKETQDYRSSVMVKR